ncbi:LexA family transcriptional regulator [Polycladidibacter hongkongensis]|uniref:LexA family transcriptional regulator n=1 Tax=Polycladidibacter hongkongensis TaxID=1647556 RepID=UPI000829908C|nr:helix-turn-helix domain-containing protein [Pseudovibrio hongkongensis]
MSTLAERLRIARERAGFETASAAAAALGIKEPTYIHHENNTRRPRAASIDRYARFFGVQPAWLAFGTQPVHSDRAPDQTHHAKAAKLLTPASVPVFSGEAGRNGQIEAPDEPVDQINCPNFLAEIAGAYALYMPGLSMEPRYHEGEALFLNPKPIPKPGEYVNVQFRAPESDIPMWMVAKYEGAEGNNRVFSRYNAERQLIPSEAIFAMHKIIATGEW